MKKQASLLLLLKMELARLESTAKNAYQQQKEYSLMGLDLDSPSMAYEIGLENGCNDGVSVLRAAIQLVEHEG
ncbi:hypothetical protein [Endozoicomonas sp.]|uniref:hypothetical protein n=1 Tax=Endozoicomonas sp. TaxID=1892382 RepID=UPI003AF897B1